MSSNPSDRKLRNAMNELAEDMGGDLFGLDLEEVPEDPIYKMRKYVTHFRLMVLLQNFPYIHEGTILTYGKPGHHEYATGLVTSTGTISIPTLNAEVPSLTGFATEVVPSKWTKADSRTGTVSRARPDGWERVWATMDDGSAMRVEEVLFKHHSETGYTVEQLSNIQFLHEELSKMGHGDSIKDLSSELKSYLTKSKKK